MASSKKFVVLFCITLISLVAVGCSDDSNPVSTDRAPLDSQAPAIPADLGVAFDVEVGTATVSWGANVIDTDLAGYVVSRDHYGTVEYLVATPSMINAYVDAAPLLGISNYEVYAVDETGNKSEVASVQLVRTSSHQAHELQQ